MAISCLHAYDSCGGILHSSNFGNRLQFPALLSIEICTVVTHSFFIFIENSIIKYTWKKEQFGGSYDILKSPNKNILFQ